MDIVITPQALKGRVNAPASKSVAHRQLICASLAKEPSRIKINKTSEDIEATLRCLRAIGVKIEVEGENYICTPPEKHVVGATLDCGESGSTLRFMLPVVAALGIDATFIGHGRLPSRPLEPLKSEMQKHGISFSDTFPLKIKGKMTGGDFTLRGDVSSQFVTGLLLSLPLCKEKSILHILPPVESKPYIDITKQVISEFGVKITENGNTYSIEPSSFSSGDFTAEGDWSNGAFWLSSSVETSGLRLNSTQGDRKILDVLKQFGAEIEINDNFIKTDISNLKGTRIDASDIPDLVPVICALASTAMGQTVIYNASRLRIKESDRIVSTVSMINSLGGDAKATDDGMIITGKPILEGGTVDSFSDHRIVMASAVAAIKCRDKVTIRNAQAVNKSYPDFFNEYNLLGGAANVV